MPQVVMLGRRNADSDTLAVISMNLAAKARGGRAGKSIVET